MPIRIFISHSSKDEKLAEMLADLIHSQLKGIETSHIRCTSVDGYKFSGGADVEDEIRQEVRDADVFLSLVSPQSRDSAWVAFEHGARWGQYKSLIPLLAPGVGTDSLAGPLVNLHALRCDESAQMQQLLEQLSAELGSELESPAKADRLISEIVKWQHDDDAKGIEVVTVDEADPDQAIPKVSQDAHKMVKAFLGSQDGQLTQPNLMRAVGIPNELKFRAVLRQCKGMVGPVVTMGRRNGPQVYEITSTGIDYLTHHGFL